MSDALKRAQDCLVIHAVNLRESRVEIQDDIDLVVYDRAQAQRQSFSATRRVQESILRDDTSAEDAREYRFDHALGVRFLRSEEEAESEDPLVDLEITAVFQARYACAQKLDEEALRAFAKDNVGFQVWPYWREFVQSTCNRLGMSPPIDIPMYRIKKAETVESDNLPGHDK